MDGYSTLRTRVQRFLKDNPDVQTLTLKRPKEKKKIPYLNGRAECFGRVPESCPVVQEVIADKLPDGVRVLRPDGTEIDLDDLRRDLFQALHDRVTMPFRNALEEVCEQKHTLLSRVSGYQRQMRDWIDEAETEVPPDEQQRLARVRSRRGTVQEVEVEIEEDDL
jgi:hypothetical protein